MVFTDDELLNMAKKWKLRWFDNVFWLSTDDSIGKMQRQRRGRQQMRWKDNMKEWAGMDIASTTTVGDSESCDLFGKNIHSIKNNEKLGEICGL